MQIKKKNMCQTLGNKAMKHKDIKMESFNGLAIFEEWQKDTNNAHFIQIIQAKMTNLSSVHSVNKRCANRHPLNGFIIFYSGNYAIFTLSLLNSNFKVWVYLIQHFGPCFLDRTSRAQTYHHWAREFMVVSFYLLSFIYLLPQEKLCIIVYKTKEKQPRNFPSSNVNVRF